MKYKLKPEAKKIYDLGGSLEIEDGDPLMNFANNISCSDGFGYGLFDGGYIYPEQIMEPSPELDELKKAIKLVGEFKKLYEMIAAEI